MNIPFIKKKQTLKRKLFGYMFLLVVLLLIMLLMGMYLIGGYSGTKQRMAATLEFQTDVFERQVTTYFSSLAVKGIQLSEMGAEIIDDYLQAAAISFDALKGSQKHIAGIQEALIDKLHQKLLETDCTGAFIVLDTQVNPSVENAATSRSGIYLQRNSLDSTDTRILLYRGLSDIGKNHSAMPHRKWRLEFDISCIPDYAELFENAALPLEQSCKLSSVVTLKGTSERAMYFMLPIFGENGRVYGLCGFEINASYFKHVFAQPSELTHAVFCLNKGGSGLRDAQDCLSAGVLNDYYLAPRGQFNSKPFGSGLVACQSDEADYVGFVRSLQLCPGQTFSLSTLVLRRDYDEIAAGDSLRITLLLVVLLTFSALSCLYFSKRYLRPLKQSIDRIRQKEYANAESQVAEIDDLFAFLAEQDRRSEEKLAAMQEEKSCAQAELAQIRSERAQDKQELRRLAYSRKSEVDPEDYENFCRGINDLTATERRVFDYYLEGRSVKEITELMGVKESTVRFHNRNIYTTLGVNSLKQLLRCAAIMKQEKEAEP